MILCNKVVHMEIIRNRIRNLYFPTDKIFLFNGRRMGGSNYLACMGKAGNAADILSGILDENIMLVRPTRI
jgi:hypothetical protein